MHLSVGCWLGAEKQLRALLVAGELLCGAERESAELL